MKTLKIPAYLSRRIVGSLLGLTTSLVAAQNPPDLVGEVTLLIGQAQVILSLIHISEPTRPY